MLHGDLFNFSWVKKKVKLQIKNVGNPLLLNHLRWDYPVSGGAISKY